VFKFGLIALQASGAFTFSIAEKVNKKSRKYKLLPVKQCIFEPPPPSLTLTIPWGKIK